MAMIMDLTFLYTVLQVQVKSISEFNQLYFNGDDHHKNYQKVVNDTVRRSHKGLVIYVCSRDEDSRDSVDGKINFVDLAGCNPLMYNFVSEGYLSMKFFFLL